MNAEQIQDKFEQIGARVRFGKFQRDTQFVSSWMRDRTLFAWVEDGRVKLSHDPPGATGAEISIDVRRDRRGELFVIEASERVSLNVLEYRPGQKHLLLFAGSRAERLRFLCGHDEMHWYVAAVPDMQRPATNIQSAMEALKPDQAKIAQHLNRVKSRKRNKRKNKGFVRQGEWFFIPAENPVVDERMILKNEPLSRGAGSKPHFVEELYRIGGETVYVCNALPQGITEEQRSELFKTVSDEHRPIVMGWRWTLMKRNPEVYARGRVRHSDHKTIVLYDWHRVFMNTEDKSAASKNVVFLD